MQSRHPLERNALALASRLVAETPSVVLYSRPDRPLPVDLAADLQSSMDEIDFLEAGPWTHVHPAPQNARSEPIEDLAIRIDGDAGRSGRRPPVGPNHVGKPRPEGGMGNLRQYGFEDLGLFAPKV